MNGTPMADGERGAVELKRSPMSLAEWKATPAGLWGWVFQRVSALVLLVLIGVHVAFPYALATQALLLGAAIFHGVLGIRVILVDVGLSARWQRALFGGLTVAGIVVFLAVWGRIP
jgi:succinate dehydrogenase / fumarate reductase cytochrome b subunit